MDYKLAELDSNLITQLEQFETEIRKQTSENIIIIAYQSEADKQTEVANTSITHVHK